LHETYLEKLGAESGLAYSRLTDLQHLSLALKNPKLATEKVVQIDIRRQPALLALLMLSLVYLPRIYKSRQFSWH
jgi:mxaL protein